MTTSTPLTTLTLVRLRPDMVRLVRWASVSGPRNASADVGYTLHAATRATLGSLAPKPFVLRQRADGVELVGYTVARPEDLARACALDAHDPEAASALRLEELVAKAMPVDWRAGETFSFEVRVAPVVRSRSELPGSYVEVDAAFHSEYMQTPGDRVAAYGAWIKAQLGREGAAELLSNETINFQLTDMVRRTHSSAGGEAHESGATGRQGRRGLLPDLTVRGALKVANGPAFAKLVARGLGRHRAFGFGCLLLTRPAPFTGTFDAQRPAGSGPRADCSR